MKLPKYSTWDLVAIVIIGVVFGVLNAQFSALWMILMGVGGRALANITFGLFYIGNALAIFIIRKPGVSLLTGVIMGIVEMLAGSPYGVASVALTTAQGLGVDLGFALFRYKRWDWLSAAVAALMVGPFHFMVGCPLSRCWTLPLWNIPNYLLGYVEGVVFAGFGTVLLARLLLKTGVLSGFKIAEKSPEA